MEPTRWEEISSFACVWLMRHKALTFSQLVDSYTGELQKLKML